MMQQLLRLRRLALLLVVILVAGCAGIEPDPDTVEREDDEVESARVDPDPAPEEPEEPVLVPDLAPEPEPRPRGFTGDSLYQLLVAELAGRQGDLDTALENYLSAARETRDPRVAERAARTALHLERHDVAIEAAERWVELRPRERAPHAVLARLHLLTGNPDRAAEHMRAVIDVSEDTDTGLREVAALAGQVEDPPVVIAAVRQVLADFPEATVLHYTVAFQAAEAGDHDTALAAVDDALTLDPDYARALLLEAEILLARDEADEALAVLGEARERVPGDRDIALGYVRLLIETGEHDAAVREMQQVFEDFGGDGHVVNTLGFTALRIGALDDARIYFQRQLAMEGRPDEARFYLGRIAERQGDLDEAMAQYIQVGGREYRFDAQQRFAVGMAQQGRVDEALLHLERLRHAYRGTEAQLELERTRAEIEWQGGDSQAALGIMNNLVEAHPDNDDLRYSRAIFAADSGHFELARSDLEAMLERNPDAAHLQNALGYTLADHGVELERARRLIERALEQRPGDAAILDSMGWVLYRQGEHAKALEYLRAAWERSRDAEIGAHLGEVLWVLGERSEARAIWDAAAEDDPDHRVLRETVERLAE